MKLDKLAWDHFFWCWCRWNSDLSREDVKWQDQTYDHMLAEGRKAGKSIVDLDKLFDAADRVRVGRQK
jgi:hypothetical protein